MRIQNVLRTVVGFALAMGAGAIVVSAASGATGVATAKVVQKDKGIAAPFACPTPGLIVTGEHFAGSFGKVDGQSPESKVLKGSHVDVDQTAIICFTSLADPDGNVPFLGSVGGTATVSGKGKPGDNVMTAGYGAAVSGTYNQNTGAIQVQWIDGTGHYTIIAAQGIYFGPFAPGETGDATATAVSANAVAPEHGTLELTFEFAL